MTAKEFNIQLAIGSINDIIIPVKPTQLSVAEDGTHLIDGLSFTEYLRKILVDDNEDK